MKLGFTTLACPDWNLPRIIDCAKANGYDGVDFRGYMGQMSVPDLPEFTTNLSETLRMFADAGLEIPCLSSGALMYDRDNANRQVDEVRRYCELAGRVGASFVRVFGGTIEDGQIEAAYPLAAETLNRMADIAEGCGVTIAVETHDAWLVTAHLAEVMRRVNRPSVGVLWDVHNPLQMAGEPVEESLDNIASWTRYTHIKDSRRQDGGDVAYCLPGEGQVPLDRIVAGLAQRGYDGYLTVEWEKAWHPEIADAAIAMPAYAEALRRAVRNAGAA